MLISLSIFRCGNEKSVQGRTSWELTPYECTSQIAEVFAASVSARRVRSGSLYNWPRNRDQFSLPLK